MVGTAATVAASVAAAHPLGFVVLRSSGHSGSRWLSELLATQNLTFLFEFAGQCPARYTSSLNISLHEVFARACACRFDAEMEEVCASDQDGSIRSMACVKDAFCSTSCPRQDERAQGCQAVGMVDSFQPGLARRLIAARLESPVRIVTFERDNAVKHAVSKLRASCVGTSLKGNHIKAPLPTSDDNDSSTDSGSSTDGKPPAASVVASKMYIEPRLLLAETMQSLLGRRRMREGVLHTLGHPDHTMHSEDLQRAPAATLRNMFGTLGLHFDESTLGRSALVKGSSESLYAHSPPACTARPQGCLRARATS